MQLTTPHLPVFKIIVSLQLIPLQKTDIVTEQNAVHKYANTRTRTKSTLFDKERHET